MPAHTLLAHLAYQLTGRHEVLATESLAFLLEQSPAAKYAFLDLLRRHVEGLPLDLVFRAEVVGDKLDRADVVGFAVDGTTPLLLEGKFWAGLTDNQPGTYLGRLPAGRPGVLLFVVPEKRVQILWDEVRERGRKAGLVLELAAEMSELRRGSIAGRPHHLMLIAWPALLRLLESACVRTGDAMAESVRQLAGLCERQDQEAFLPLSAEEISSAEVARRTLDYVRLVNDVVANLQRRKICSTKGYKWTAQSDGCVGYVRCGGFLLGAGVRYDCTRWRKHGISPLWFTFNKPPTQEGRRGLQALRLEPPRRVLDYKGLAVPVPLPIGVEYDRIVDSCVEEIASLVERLRPFWAVAAPVELTCVDPEATREPAG